MNENEKEGKTRCKNNELKLIVSTVEELAELPRVTKVFRLYFNGILKFAN